MNRKPHILYVDDDEDIITFQQALLPRYGYEVSAFMNPLEALAHFRFNTECFDVAIIDLVMPEMKGDQLAAELKKLKPNLPIVLCTGFGTEIADNRVAELGLGGFLNKPVASKLLIETISSLIHS